MTNFKFALLFIALLCGCDSSSPLFDREPTPPETDLSIHSNKPMSSKHVTAGLTQDLNKSYNEVKGRWIHAVPLKEFNESYPGLIFNE